MKTIVVSFILLTAMMGARRAAGQMVNPAIDRQGQPFSYPSASTDEMAIFGSKLGTEITPQGYLYTGYGELMFLVGYPQKPVSQRIRTLEQGYLPILNYTYRDGSVRFRIITFTCPLVAGRPDREPVDLVRVHAVNLGRVERTSFFSVAFRYSGKVDDPVGVPDHCFGRPAMSTQLGGYDQPGVVFNQGWVYGFERSYAERSGMVVYEFPLQPKPRLWLTRRYRFNTAKELKVLPDTPVLLAQYELHLPPGQSRTLTFRMPVRPINLTDKKDLADLRAIDFSEAKAGVINDWKAILRRGLQIELPEKEVTDTFRASLIYDMMAVDRVDSNYIQNVNKLQYHAFWLRDGSHIISAYDASGHFGMARRCLLFFLKKQQPDGLFISQPGQYDGWGQALWAFGRYYQFTHDKSFARTVYPAVQRAVHWLVIARKGDPLHLMPAANPGDDEFSWMTGHVVGQNFWALNGLRAAIILAKGVGTQEEVKEYQRQYLQFRQRLLSVLSRVTSRTGGYIPPAIDARGGHDWGNLDTLYPEILFAPSNPWVTATLKHARSEYAEGILTYGRRLHLYLGFRNTEAELIRGEQDQVVKDLYAMLVHTSSTHAGWEMVRPAAWTTRDFAQDLAPHGWFAAEYVVLLRNMLLREQGAELQLMSALSPGWCKPGDNIEVKNAPTHFGKLDMRAQFRGDGMSLELAHQFSSPPRKIVLHLPWFVTAKSAEADGKPLTVQGDHVVIPPGAHKIAVQWAEPPSYPNLSYANAVKRFLGDYKKHYQNFRRTGSSVLRGEQSGGRRQTQN